MAKYRFWHTHSLVVTGLSEDPVGVGEKTERVADPDGDSATPPSTPSIMFYKTPKYQAAAVLSIMIATYWIVFGFLVYRQQSNFGTFGFDIGIHDQGIWLVSRGQVPFVTVRGLDYFAHHVNLISMIFVPFYWLGAGPHFLIIIHTLAVAAGAIPLWLLARDRLRNSWLALVVPAAYLLYPATNWITWWAYHPDSLSITPLLFAYWLAVRGRWRWFAVAVIIALLCKEDTALSVLMLGLIILLWLKPTGPSPGLKDKIKRRRIGALTAVAGLTWYLLCTKLIIPWRNHGHAPFYESFFPALGSSLPEVMYNAIRHPSRIWHLARLPDRRLYYRQMFIPVAFLPILALPAFLVGGPQFGVDITAQQVQGATIKSQYASLVLVGVFLATVEALGMLRRRLPRLMLVAVGTLAISSVISAHLWGLAPFSNQFHKGDWAAHNPKSQQLHAALNMIPADAGVSVTYYLTPHVTHRRFVYEFPNPWVGTYYGLKPTDHGDPNTVQWLILDRATFDLATQNVLAPLIAPGGAFQVVYDSNAIIVAHRTIILTGPVSP